MLLIAGVLAVVAVVLFLVLSGGDDPGGEQAASSATPAAGATPTPTPTAAPAQVADTIPLRSSTGGKAKGTMTVYLQDGQLLFALEARNVPPSGARAAYAVWFTGPGGKAHRLGFTNPVGEDGQLGIQGPSEKDARRLPQAVRDVRAGGRLPGDLRDREAAERQGDPQRQAAQGPLGTPARAAASPGS